MPIIIKVMMSSCDIKPVACLSLHSMLLYTGKPEEIQSLKLDSSGREETLTWKRPQNSLDNVPITYKVSINTTEGAAVSENYTANQFLSLGFVERQARSTGRRCELYSITVEAMNEDGSGPPSKSIVTTIPTCKKDVH